MKNCTQNLMKFSYSRFNSKVLLFTLAYAVFAAGEYSYAGGKTELEEDSPGKLTEVTILADRAEVTRVKTVHCPGSQRGIIARFTALPQLIQVKTLRAEVKGPAEVIGVTHTPTVQGAFQPHSLEEENALKKAQRDARKASRKREAERAQLEERLKRLREDSELIAEAVSQGLRSGTLDVKEMAKSLDLQNSSRQAAMERLSQLKREDLEAKKALELLATKEQDQALKIASELNQNGGEASVSMTCSGSGAVTVGLNYVTSGVSWSLDYRVSIESSAERKGNVEWAVNSIIRQMTGEDWKGVSLTLSTAQPNLGDRAPLPNPLHIGAQSKPKVRVLSQRTEDRSSLQSGGVAAESPRLESVSIEDRGQSFGLRVPKPVTIKSSGEPYWVPVSVSKSKAKLRLVSTPKLSSYVFKVARFKNPASHPLPSGQVSLSINGEYQGRLSNEYYGVGAPIELTLGVEEGLRISRELDLGKDHEAGLLEGDQSLIRSFKVKVTSSSKKTQRLEITENLPVSEIDEIKVTLNKEKTTSDFVYQAETGFVTWDLKLKPLKSKELIFAYEIKMPDDWKLK